MLDAVLISYMPNLPLQILAVHRTPELRFRALLTEDTLTVGLALV